MLLTKRGKRWEMFESCSTWHHPSAMYGVVCMYKVELSSVSGASSLAMCRIAAEGAGVGTVGGRRVSAGPFDVEDNEDGQASFVNELPILPVGDD